MRVLRVHNHYKERGGEDAVFAAETNLLRDAGDDVSTLEFFNDDIAENPSLKSQLGLAGTTIWSSKGREQISAAVREFRPEVVHFDNTFPLVSPAAYSAAGKAGSAVVQTLHNYRLLCPSVTLFRDNQICEDCIGKPVPLPGVIHGCYRGSRAQSAVVAAMLTAHRLRRTWSRDVDRYIALTEFTQAKFIEGGLPSELMVVKPNCLDIPAPRSSGERTGMAYVGRLAPEKGIQTLLHAWESLPEFSLTIVGDGPLKPEVINREQGSRLISYLGRQEQAETYRIMAQSTALVVPSEWYEPFGLVVIEAFAHGTPVIAAHSGGITELVDNGRTGLLFEPGNVEALISTVQWAEDHPEEMRRMGDNARREYEAKYTPERNYEMLMEIYQQATHAANSRRA